MAHETSHRARALGPTLLLWWLVGVLGACTAGEDGPVGVTAASEATKYINPPSSTNWPGVELPVPELMSMRVDCARALAPTRVRSNAARTMEASRGSKGV